MVPKGMSASYQMDDAACGTSKENTTRYPVSFPNEVFVCIAPGANPACSGTSIRCFNLAVYHRSDVPTASCGCSPAEQASTRLGRTSSLPMGDTMSNQTSDRRPTRMVRAQDLAQEDPQRDQRRIDAVDPIGIDCCQCLRHDLLREHVRERQIRVLEKLASQKSDLSLKPSWGEFRIRVAFLPVVDLLPTHHLRKRGLFAYIIFCKRLTPNLSAIRLSDLLRLRQFSDVVSAVPGTHRIMQSERQHAGRGLRGDRG